MWWSTLSLLQKIFFCVACASTLLLLIQIIMMIIGFGNDGDVDVDGIDGIGDVDGFEDSADGFSLDSDIGLSLFTVKTLSSFFAIGGWVGFAVADLGNFTAILISLFSGTAALIGMAFIMKWLTSLQSEGNINYSNAVGKIANVYLTIPANSGGIGKINLTLQERFIEANAITNDEESIKTGTMVKIVSIIDDTFVVTKNM